MKIKVIQIANYQRNIIQKQSVSKEDIHNQEEQPASSVTSTQGTQLIYGFPSWNLEKRG